MTCRLAAGPNLTARANARRVPRQSHGVAGKPLLALNPRHRLIFLAVDAGDRRAFHRMKAPVHDQNRRRKSHDLAFDLCRRRLSFCFYHS